MTTTLQHMETDVTPLFPPHTVLSYKNDADIMVQDRPKIQSCKPPQFSLFLFKDKETTTEFLIQVLATVFHKPRKEVKEIIARIDEEGYALCGVYTREIAETKVEVLKKLSKLRQLPLRYKMQKA